ncbi:MAG TPA: hypothetical protein VGH83_05820 [Candidatus Acidoferrum sp.]|jgi:hypothetical protein
MKPTMLLFLLAAIALSQATAQAPPAPSTQQGPPPPAAPPPPDSNLKQAGHQADLAYSNPACTTTNQCTLQIFRAQCDNATTCPNYIYSPQSFKTLSMAGLSTNATATGTSWTYSDTDTALQDNTSYSWVSTATFVNNPTMVSGPSSPFLGTIPALPSQVPPPAPTTGTCKIVR